MTPTGQPARRTASAQPALRSDSANVMAAVSTRGMTNKATAQLVRPRPAGDNGFELANQAG